MDIARFIARMERAPVFYRQDIHSIVDIDDLRHECKNFEHDFGIFPTGHISQYAYYNYSTSNPIRYIKQYMKVWILTPDDDENNYFYYAVTPGGERYCWNCNARYTSTPENDFKYQLHLPRICQACINRTSRLRKFIDAQ